MRITSSVFLESTLDIREPTELVADAVLSGFGHGGVDVRIHPGGSLTLNSFLGGGMRDLNIEVLPGADGVMIRRLSGGELSHVSIRNHNPFVSALSFAPEEYGKGGIYFSTIRFMRIHQPEESEASAIDFSGSTFARMNDSTLRRITVLKGKGPALSIGGSRPFQSVTVAEFNGELIKGQLIKARNMQGFRIERPVVYDTRGTVFEKHLIEIQSCEGVRIEGYDRRDGSLQDGAADIAFTGLSRNNYVHGLGDRGYNPIRYGQLVDWGGTTGTHMGIGESHIALNAEKVHLFGAGWCRLVQGEQPSWLTDQEELDTN